MTLLLLVFNNLKSISCRFSLQVWWNSTVIHLALGFLTQKFLLLFHSPYLLQKFELLISSWISLGNEDEPRNPFFLKRFTNLIVYMLLACFLAIFWMFWCLLWCFPVYFWLCLFGFSPLAQSFVHLLKEPSLRFLGCFLCFYFINFVSGFYPFFPSTRFEFGLFLFFFLNVWLASLIPFCVLIIMVFSVGTLSCKFPSWNCSEEGLRAFIVLGSHFYLILENFYFFLDIFFDPSIIW